LWFCQVALGGLTKRLKQESGMVAMNLAIIAAFRLPQISMVSLSMLDGLDLIADEIQIPVMSNSCSMALKFQQQKTNIKQSTVRKLLPECVFSHDHIGLSTGLPARLMMHPPPPIRGHIAPTT
jgi:hypothetical protein